MNETLAIGLSAAALSSPAWTVILAYKIRETYKKPRTKYTTAQLVIRRRNQIERNRARKTTKQQNRRTAQ